MNAFLWLVLEAALALALLLGIVWWTWHGKSDNEANRKDEG